MPVNLLIRCVFLLCLLLGASPRWVLAAHAPSVTRLPLHFEPAAGDGSTYVARGRGYALSVSRSGAVLRLDHAQRTPAVVQMSFADSAGGGTLEPQQPLAAKSNYFVGGASDWRTGVPNYGRVEHRGIYPGIDLVYYGNQKQLEYDLVLAPGAKPEQIRLQFGGDVRRLALDEDGNLLVKTPGGTLVQQKPLVYQQTDTGREAVAAQYVLRGARQAGIEVAAWDRSRPLVIDPVLVYSTYFGGLGDDPAYGLATDTNGNTYISGSTTSANFPVLNAAKATRGGSTDAFVAKIDASGSLVYSTYIGGSLTDFGASVAVDAAGSAYVTGQTFSTDFPAVGAFQSTLSGGSDAFLVKLNPAGNTILYSTYFGGNQNEYGFGVAVDALGSLTFCGFSSSTNMPRANAFQTTFAGSTDGFVAKLDPTGQSLVFSTYLGGSGADFANNLTTDASGNAYVFGDTTSTNFPVAGAVQPTSGGGTDGFLVKVTASGARVYSTYIGGSGTDAARSGAVDAAGYLYVTGETTSPNLAVVNAYQSTLRGGNDAFVFKLDAAGTVYSFFTYLGGTADDYGRSLRLDAFGNLYIGGATSSANFPVLNATQASTGGSSDAFVVKMDAAGSTLLFGTYFGGSGAEQGNQIGVDADGLVSLTGSTASTNLPLLQPLQSTFAGVSDAFLAKLRTCDIVVSPNSQSFGSGAGSGTVLVSGGAGCVWSTTVSAPWITLTSPAAGAGNGSVSFDISANPTPLVRTGTLRMGGQTFTVTQDTSVTGLNAVAPSFAAAGTTVNVTLTGVNFAAPATVNAGADIAVSNVVVVSATQITASFTISGAAVAGSTGITVTTLNGTGGPVAFVINPPAPTLSGVSPAAGPAGGSVAVTLTGTNFFSPVTITAGNGITPVNVVVVSATQITANLTINTNAPQGATNLLVTTSSGTSSGVSFTVGPPPPVAQIVRGSAVSVAPINASSATVSVTVPASDNVMVVGLGYYNRNISANAVSFNGKALTKVRRDNNSSFNAATELWYLKNPQILTANVVVTMSGASGASIPLDVSVTTWSGVDTTTPIEVQTGSVVTGTHTTHSDTVTTTNPGSMLVDAFTVSVNSLVTPGVNVTPVVGRVDSGVAFAVSQRGPVTPAGAVSESYTFPSTGAASAHSLIALKAAQSPGPALSLLAPSSGAAGSSVSVTLTGTNFLAPATVSAGADIAVSNVVVVSPTQITAQFDIGANAAAGAVSVTVSTAAGTSNAVPFTVNAGAPTVSGVTPGTGTLGSAVPVTISGSNLFAPVTVNAGPGVTASNVVVVNPTQLTATLTISAGAPVGPSSLSVTTGSGTSNSVTFTVTTPGPGLSSVSPPSAVMGATVAVTLTGTNFTSPATVSAGTGITVSNVVVVSATQITAQFDIASNATAGANNVTVSTASGSSSAVPFTILLPAPTLGGVAPNSGIAGASVNVTLTGTNFYAPVTVNAGTGITVSNAVVVSATQVTATLTIGAGAPVGASTLSITTGSGTSSTAAFTVNPPAPGLSSLNPTSGVMGTTAAVTLTGTNFTSPATVSAGTGITVSNVVVVSATQITAQFDIASNATAGANNVTVSTASGSSSAVPFTILLPAPTLAGVAPNSGIAGASVNVTLTGTNFYAPVTVNAGTGITVSNVAVVSATQVTATLTIGAGAPVGGSTLSATTGSGTSSTAAFTVNPPAPGLSSLNPTSGVIGTTVAVTLTGTNFASPATVSAGAGITVSNVVVVSATQITAQFDIASNATAGANNVTVSTASGSSSAVPFTILLPAPTLAGTNPTSGLAGSSVNVTLSGTNFYAPLTVNAGSGITVSNVSAGSATQATATLTIAAGAPVGASTLSVTTGSGTSGTVTFTVNPPAPGLASVSPSSGGMGTTVGVTLTGTNFAAPATVSAGSGITVSNVAVVSATQITAQFDIAANASAGANNVTVSTASGTTSPVPFTIQLPAPTLSGVTPASGIAGSSVNVSLSGTNFSAPLTVNAGAGITVSNVTVVSATQATATLTIAAGAPVGASTLSVTTGSGTSNTVTFTVNPPAPGMLSVTPASGVIGTTAAVTLTGTNFTSPATVSAGSGITVTNVAVVSATQITAQFDIAANATAGATSIAVSTASGTSNSVPFTILLPPPTLGGVTPAAGVAGSSVGVTLTGANFYAPATISGGAGIAASNVVVVSASQITATLTISAGAPIGSSTLMVSTASGTSNAVAFTVVAPTPGLSSVSPPSGMAGTSVNVTLTGTNFGAPATVSAGAGITVSNVSVNGPTQMTALFTIAGNAVPGAASVTVTTAGGTSNAVGFTITPASTITLIGTGNYNSVAPLNVSAATIPITVPAGNNLLLVALAYYNRTISAVGVSFNGVPLVKIRRDNNPSFNAATELWYLINPPVASGNAQVTMSGATGTNTPLQAAAVTFSGVSTVGTVEAQTGRVVTGTHTSQQDSVVTVTPGDLVVDVFTTAANALPVPNAGQTAIVNRVDASASLTVSQLGPVNPAGTATAGFTFPSTGAATGHSVIALKPF